MKKFICPVCGKAFFDHPHENRKYCSKVCMGIAERGASHSQWKGGIHSNKYIYNKFFKVYGKDRFRERILNYMQQEG